MARLMTSLFFESVPRFDIRAMVRRYGKAPFSGYAVALTIGAHQHSADLEHVPRHLGGTRVYFLCRCGRRCDILYRSGGRLACRACHRLVYWSQALGPVSRRTHTLARQRHKLGQPRDQGLGVDFPPQAQMDALADL